MTAADGRRALRPAGMSDAGAAGYSHGVAAGGGVWVHVAGQVSEGDSPAAQVEGALRGVEAVCREAGGSMADVVSMTWFTTEPVADLWASSGAARRRLFPDPPPAMTCVRVAGLADPKYVIEIVAVAVVGPTP